MFSVNDVIFLNYKKKGQNYYWNQEGKNQYLNQNHVYFPLAFGLNFD